MIRIIMADDHALVRGGIRQLLALAPDMQLVAEVASGAELMQQLAATTCHVLLLDLSMPGLSGLALIPELVANYPEMRIVVLTMHNEGQMVSRALKVGASGYVTKDSDSDVLLTAIRKVHRGIRYIDPSLGEKNPLIAPEPTSPEGPAISARERSVLQLIAAGCSLTEIADRLALSPKTVSTYKMRLMQKLGISNNADLVRHAIRAGVSSD